MDVLSFKEAVMSSQKPWEPKIDSPDYFNAEPNVVDKARDSTIQNPEEDTGPLEGTHDLSDEDSLEDVVADAYSDRKSDKKPAQDTES
jgi:hypothetical protein